MKNERRTEIRKKEVREQLEISNAGNFKKIINELEKEGFFKEHNITCPDGQVIYFSEELIQQSS